MPEIGYQITNGTRQGLGHGDLETELSTWLTLQYGYQ